MKRLLPGVVLLALVCAGCNSNSTRSGPDANGPLGPPQNHVTQCTPALKAGQPVTIGLLAVQDKGSQPLVIYGVTLAKPRKGAGLGLAGWG